MAPAAEVEQVKVSDADHDHHQAVLLARIRAVVVAQHRFAAGEPDASYVLRQSLIDLAAISEALADELPAPSAF